MTEVVSLRRELTFDSFTFELLSRHRCRCRCLLLPFFMTQAPRHRKCFVFVVRYQLCDEMVSPISTVTHCGLQFSQSNHSYRQTLFAEWVLMLMLQSLFLSVSLSFSTLKLLNNLYCSVVEYALVAE